APRPCDFLGVTSQAVGGVCGEEKRLRLSALGTPEGGGASDGEAARFPCKTQDSFDRQGRAAFNSSLSLSKSSAGTGRSRARSIRLPFTAASRHSIFGQMYAPRPDFLPVGSTERSPL